MRSRNRRGAFLACWKLDTVFRNCLSQICFIGGEKYAGEGGGGYATTPEQTNNTCTLVNGAYSMLATSVFVRIFYKRRISNLSK